MNSIQSARKDTDLGGVERVLARASLCDPLRFGVVRSFAHVGCACKESENLDVGARELGPEFSRADCLCEE